MDGQGRSWEVLPIKEVRIAVQVQDAAGNPLSGYRFAVADPKVGNLTGYRKINAGGSVFSLRPRSESVILRIEGSAASGAVFPVYRQFTVPSLTRHLRLAYESRTPSARPYRSRKRPKPGASASEPFKAGNPVTPDIFRGGDGNERLMLRGQAQAWEDVSGIQTFRIRNPANGQWVNVNVNVQPVAFNFGVNQGGVSGFGPISSDGSMGGSSMLGWGMADEMNQQGLETLLGQNLDPTNAPDGIVGQEILRLQNGNQQEQQRAIHLRTLSDQIRTMWQDQSHRRDEGEAYKMVSRLALLSHMAGIKVAFNCKSGKDRTGNLDTEVKFLAAYIAVRNVVPPPGTPLTVLEQTDLRNLSKESGSRYWQLLNTGVEGYKLKGVPSIPTRIGGPVAYSDFLGASDATHE